MFDYWTNQKTSIRLGSIEFDHFFRIGFDCFFWGGLVLFDSQTTLGLYKEASEKRGLK